MSNPIKILAVLGVVSLTWFAVMAYAAVDLNYFTAQWNSDQVTLHWETGNELDHAAFHVWRSTENLPINESSQIDKSRAERLTDAFLLNPDINPCSQQGYEYEYVDNTINHNQQAYYYYLESFNCSDGRSEFQGGLGQTSGLEVLNPNPSLATRTVTPSVSATTYVAAHLYLPLIMHFLPSDYYAFEASQTFYQSNCNLTQVKGIIWDGVNNSRLNDVTVRVWYDGAAFHEHYSAPSGSPPRKPGEWEITLATSPKYGQWYVQVVDRYSGDALSPKETVYTDSYWCESGQGGRQIVIQDFVKHSVGSGAPISASPTSTPNPWDYPYPPPPTVVKWETAEAWDTPTPWVTRTATTTPTITPTRTPIVSVKEVPASSKTPSPTEPAAVPETPITSSTPSASPQSLTPVPSLTP